MSKLSFAASAASAAFVLAGLMAPVPPLMAKSAKCLLVVDGKTYINGACKFRFEGGDGSFTFDDERIRLGCFAYDLGSGECSGAATEVIRNGVFGGLSIQGSGVGRFWWNEGTPSKRFLGDA